MNIIKFLPEETIRKISTGEFINNTYHVLKELLENSLDAKCSKIKIEILNSGLDLIKVTDNGIGICKEDLFLSIKRHTTSKIYYFNDLLYLKTFGFRGEALSCISAVSNFSISSKYMYSNDSYGWLLFNSENKLLNFNLKPISHNFGTIVSVKNIFLNILNKRKELFFFNKNEWFYIKKIINYFSLSNYKINFLIYRDKILYKNYITKYKKDNLNILDRIKFIYGKKFIENYQYVDIFDKYFILKGYIFRKNNTKNIKLIFLNNRIISSDNLLYSVLDNFFLDFFNKNIFFSYILYFNIESKYININLCPNKNKIFFLDSYFIFNRLNKNLCFFFKNFKKNIYKEKCFQNNINVNNFFLNNYLHYFSIYFGNIVNILDKRFIFSLRRDGLLIISDLLYIFYYMNNIIFKKKYFFLIKIKKINDVKIYLSKKYFLSNKKIFFILCKLGINICYKNNYFLINSVPSYLVNLDFKNFFLSFLKFIKKIKKKKNIQSIIFYWLSYYIIINNEWTRFNLMKLIYIFHKYLINFKYRFKKKSFYFLNFNRLFFYFFNDIWL